MKNLFSFLSLLLFVAMVFSCSDDDDNMMTNDNDTDTTGTEIDTVIVPTGSPNLVIIYMDDQGYGDVGAFGAANNIQTPELDKMANQGMRFTDFYSASSICSPARAGLLTGCFPPRVDINKAFFPDATKGLSQDETTLAELLKSNGYATTLVGKWHLGHQNEFLPLRHGFDEFYGLPYSNDMWPVDFDGVQLSEKPNSNAGEWKKQAPQLPLTEGDSKIEEVRTLEDQGLLTQKYTERAVQFINDNSGGPFFLYLAHTMPHVPIAASPDFQGKAGADNPYGDVILELDWSVGEIMKALEDNGIDDNTLVIFTTDNGPWLRYGNHGGSAGELREGKTTLFDGGFRVPCIMRWPNVIPSGSVYENMASTIDILPTVAQIIGADLPEERIDGVSMLPVLSGEQSSAYREEFYFYRAGNLLGVRYNNWKYLFPHQYQPIALTTVRNDGLPGMTVSDQFPGGLFNLDNDISEAVDVQGVNADIVDLLESKADSVRQILGDDDLNITGSEVRQVPGVYRIL